LALGGALTALNIWPGALEDAEDRLGVAEDVARAEEAGHRALDASDGGISVLIAAEEPLESLSCLPARIARKGMKWATVMPMADSICSAVAPIIAPKTAAEAMAPWTTWSTL
jgi:hypothetical protein